jgi:hypothetical protein
MRKVYYVLCFLLIGSVGSAQVLTESFDGATFPPTGWLNTVISTGTTTSGGINGDVWTRVTVGNNEAATVNPLSGAAMAKYASYDFNLNSSASLTTPQLNFSTGGPYRVRFWMYRSGTYTNRDSIDVFVNTSTTLGTATKIGSAKRLITEPPVLAAPAWDEYTFNIPASFNTSSNYVIFQAIGMYGLNMFIDDVVVEAVPACGVANSIAASASTTSSLTFTWAAPSTGTPVNYSYELRTSGAAGSGATGLVSSGSTASLTTTFNSLSSGTTYQFYLKTNCTGSQFSTFSNALNATTAITNDEPCSAIAMTINSGQTCTSVVSATNDGATASAGLGYTNPAACAIATTPKDVWFKLTTNASGNGSTSLQFTLTPTASSTLVSGTLILFSSTGTCPTLTLTPVANACTAVDFISSSSPLVMVATGLTPNTTYYLRMNSYYSADPTGSFTICASVPVAPPANDDCSGAIAVSSYSGTVNGTTDGGTATTGVTGTCAGTADDDVWYKFVALQNGNASVNVTGGAGFDAVVGVYSGTCGSLALIGSCVDASGAAALETVALTGLVQGQTYYVRIYDYYSFRGVFTVSISGAAVPVSLVSFNGSRQANNNALSWTTATEINNAGFELQRSVDGKSFSSLAFVASKAENGTSNASLTYSFNDKIVLAASYYYRLKQIDKDGKSIVSNIVFIKGTKATKLEMVSIYPNPAVENLNVSVASPKSDKVTFIISDLAGKVIIRQSANVVNGDNNIQLNVSSLAKGTYTVKAVCADGCETAISKFIKQ